MIGEEVKKIKKLIKSKNYLLAKQKIESLLAIYPDNNILKFNYARVLSRFGNLSDSESKNNLLKANNYLEELLKENDIDVYTLLELARVKIKLNNFNEAKACLLKIYQINPKDVFCRIELGKLEKKLGNYDEAKGYFINALEIDPNDIHALLELGIIEFQLGQYDVSENYFNRILEIKPDDKYAILELSNLEIKRKNNEKARQYLKSVTSENEEDIFILLKLSEIEMLDKNYNQSLFYCEQAFKLRPFNIQIICKLIYLYVNVNDIKSAEGLFDKLMAMNTSKLKKFKDFIDNLKWDLLLLDSNNNSVSHEFTNKIIKFSKKTFKEETE